MARNQEESWIENGLIDNLRIRWIIRDRSKRDRVFVAQLEYTNRPKNKNVILRWDGAHNKYHIDIYDSKGKKIDTQDCRPTLPPISEQVDIVFEDLEKNLFKILDKKFHSVLLGKITNEAKLFQDRLTAIKKAITNQLSTNKKLKLGTRHWGQHIKAKANIVKIKDSIGIELRDSQGNLREKRNQ